MPGQERPRALRERKATLKPSGVLFCSNPRRQYEEGWYGDRYGTWLDLNAWRAPMHDGGFIELECYYRPPGLPPRAATVAGNYVAQVAVRAPSTCNRSG